MKTSQEVREAAGLTTRQFHRFIHEGVIGTLDHAPGSGFHRRFTDKDAEHIVLFAQLWRAGMKPDAASGAAAQIQEYGEARLGHFRLRLALLGDREEADRG